MDGSRAQLTFTCPPLSERSYCQFGPGPCGEEDFTQHQNLCMRRYGCASHRLPKRQREMDEQRDTKTERHADKIHTQKDTKGDRERNTERQGDVRYSEGRTSKSYITECREGYSTKGDSCPGKCGANDTSHQCARAPPRARTTTVTTPAHHSHNIAATRTIMSHPTHQNFL